MKKACLVLAATLCVAATAQSLARPGESDGSPGQAGDDGGASSYAVAAGSSGGPLTSVLTSHSWSGAPESARGPAASPDGPGPDRDELPFTELGLSLGVFGLLTLVLLAVGLTARFRAGSR